MNKEFSAGTADEQRTKDDSKHVSPACIKPNVVGSLLGQREIKFRGTRVDNGERVYGDLIQYSKTECKILESFYRQWDILEGGYDVIPESVGQFTTLKDKNGKEIYEGDILKNTTRREVFGFFDNEYKYKEEITETVDIVEWQKSWASFSLTKRSEWGVFEVIGNIFENPELLETLR